MIRRMKRGAWRLPAVVGLATGCSASAPNGTNDHESPRDADVNGTPANTSEGAIDGGAGASTSAASSDTPAAPGAPRLPPTTTSNGAVPGVTPPQTTGLTTDSGHVPPTALCEGNLPASFTTACSGCHNPAGAANDRYPDLYAFDGTLDDFVAKVRSGGNGMAAYPESVLADAELTAIYAHFTSGATRPNAQAAARDDLTPLFNGTTNPPIVFTRADGVLITRGAGRVRQRHELEGSFNPYGPHYFEDRSFGILVEDYTPLGQSLIRVTYLPVGQPTPGTNFRAWKIYGDGNVFHANMGMDTATMPDLGGSPLEMTHNYADVIAPYKALQSQKTSTNSRTGQPIAPGDSFEFEFGVFLEADEVREGSRTSYYSDTYRYRVGVGGFTADNADPAGKLGPVRRAQQGGDGTNVWLYEDVEFAFEQMALNIQHENVQAFLRGRRLFHTDFATGKHSEGGNPIFEEQREKAGPLLLTNQCVTCHLHNGPGEAFSVFDETASTTFKLYDADTLGNQLQLGEGDVTLEESASSVVTLGDGTKVTLTAPRFRASAANGDALRYSPRLARKLIGLGLLEAIEEATILMRSDPADCDGDGISGRPSLVLDPETRKLVLGRFGWKAEKASVRHQVMDALQNDLDVGTAALPDSLGRVELQEAELADLTAYMRLLSVPAQRDVDDASVVTGEALFRTVGCAHCHVTDVVTGTNHSFVEFHAQAIKPYTDLLLHDMGAGLADSSELVESDELSPPAASEWRTPPLWGLGLYATVNGHTRLLHDGRAANVTEAILWHGGEASHVRERFAALSAEERAALLAFVESL